jgi:phage shock protein PspC (stress-responsive transcriptional regulator)
MVSLRRRTERRLVAGVAGGIADRLNASVAFVRIAAGLAIALVPWAVWCYAAAALLIPARGQARPGWDNLVGVARLGLVFLVPMLALPRTLDVSDTSHGPVGLWVACVGLLVAGGAALFASGYASERPAGADPRRTVLASLPVAGCVILLLAGMLVLPDTRWEAFVPLIALTGGAALLAAAWRGSWRVFVTPAVVALAVCGVLTAADARLEGGLGDFQARAAGTTAEPMVVRRAVGDVTIDVSRRAGGEDPAVLDVSVGVGDVRVSVPKGTDVEVVARVGRGELATHFVNDPSEDLQGFDLRTKRSFLSRAKQPKRVRVVADVGLGSVEVKRHTPGEPPWGDE